MFKFISFSSQIYCKSDKNKNDIENEIENQINYFNDNKIKIANEGFDKKLIDENKNKEKHMVKDDMTDMKADFNDQQILIKINKENIYI